MSGHNKWSTIKHKKGKADEKRGQIFTKLIKEITLSARMGGGDQIGNARLRAAILLAKQSNMPRDNIERAIKKGTGELAGVSYEEFTYEGYGPAGVAILVDVMTDNKNRTTADIRHLFTKYNGNLGESGCVSWMFNKRGLIAFDGAKHTEDTVMEIALEAGALDVKSTGDQIEVITEQENYFTVLETFKTKGLECLSSSLAKVPHTMVNLARKPAETAIKLLDALEDLDDVQNVYSNAEFDDAVMEELSRNM